MKFTIEEIVELIRKYGTVYAWYSKEAEQNCGCIGYIGLNGEITKVTMVCENNDPQNYMWEDKIFLGLVVYCTAIPKNKFIIRNYSTGCSGVNEEYTFDFIDA